MSDPDLPQPIYPTSRGEASPPPEPPRPGPGRGWMERLPKKAALVVGAVLVVVVVGAVVALGGGGDDPPPQAAERTGSERTDDTGPRTGTADDLGDRAVEVAEMQFVSSVSDSTVDCLAEELAADPEMLQLFEAGGDTGIVTDSPSEARQAAGVITSCATTDELVEELALAYEDGFGLEPYQLECLEADMSTWTTGVWVDSLAVVFQPSQHPQVEAYITQVLGYC